MCWVWVGRCVLLCVGCVGLMFVVTRVVLLFWYDSFTFCFGLLIVLLWVSLFVVGLSCF